MFRWTVLIGLIATIGVAAAQVATTQQTVEIKQLAPPQSGAKNGDTLFVIYTGKLTNGTVFDSNAGGRLFRFNLGEGSVIKGWDQGLLGMQVGEKRQIIIPPSLGYGPTAHGSIPANSTLTFDIELVGLVRVPK